MEQSTKTRDISIYTFFEKLQEEWVVAELRYKIYPKKKDREFWKKVMEGKKEKINNIADRNAIPSIFSNNEIKQVLYQRIYTEGGLPNFIYKNEDQRKAMEYFDKRNYFMLGVEFKTFENKIGILTFVNLEKSKCMLKFADETTKELLLSDVVRIL